MTGGVDARLRARFGLDATDGVPLDLRPLYVLLGLLFVDQLDNAAFSVLLPDIRDAFGLTSSEVSLIATLLVPVTLLVALPMGFVADRRRRTRMAAIGAAGWGISTALTGVAPNIWSLAATRAGAGIGGTVVNPTHQGLIADWYPPEVRTGAYSLWRLAGSAGKVVGPLLAGGVAALAGWRPAFLAAAVPTFVFAWLMSRMPEPVRGGQERKARGGDAEIVALEDEPPSWDEAWRTLNGVRTLRRVWRALPFLVGGLLGTAILLPLYYEDVLGLGSGTRGLMAGVSELFSVVGLVVGIRYVGGLVRRAPARVFTAFGILGVAVAVGLVIIAAAPNAGVALVGACLVQLASAAVGPGVATVVSLITPPRARSFGFSVVDLWILPGLVFAVVASRIGQAYGLRIGLLTMVAVFLVGAAVVASAGTQVADDIRAVQQAALAHAESRRARDAGEAKLLVCRGVDVRYGQVQVLFGVDFDVADGEIVALLGTNGAGKSTLLRAICGLTEPSGGAVVFDGTDITHASPQASMRRGVVLMPGGKAVFPSLSVGENLDMATWPSPQRPAIEDVLDLFPRLRERLDQPSAHLSGGEQQMLGLAMALLAKPRLLMIDELSLGLAPVIVGQLLVGVRRLRDQGTTVILVEQSVNVALTVAERAVFLEKGEVRFEGPTAELLERPDVLRSVFLEGAATAAVVRSTDGRPRPTVPATPHAPSTPRPSTVETGAALELRDVAVSFGGIRAVQGVDLVVPEAGIVGLIGPNGAGKTTLMDLVSGYTTPDRGTILLGGVDVTRWPAQTRAAGGLGRSFQDARLFPSMTVREAVALAHQRYLVAAGPMATAFGLPAQRAEELLVQERVDEVVDVLGLGAFASRYLSELSTGTRRIVDLACALVHDPKVLLLDEPSSGIAQRETEAMGPLLSSIPRWSGAALVVIEHDMPLITGISDTLVALDLGRVVATGAPADVFADPAVTASYLGDDDAAIARSG
jgi:ABC-type branched-subunit amino acid transport system ATPase component/predicted MFS family arabinose efflux permease